MISVSNSNFKLNYQIVTRNKTLYYCLKNGKYSKNSDKISFKGVVDVEFK